MLQTYRCRVCGYLQVGEPTDNCPMCQALPKAFEEYTAPDLTGTKTVENLMAAFAGESQANRRYTLFRRIAELEGAPQSTLDAFDRAMREETAHALSHLVYAGGYGSTGANLDAASAGEDHEQMDMYPQMAETAEAEGFPEIAFYFRQVGKYEGEHSQGYVAAKQELEG